MEGHESGYLEASIPRFPSWVGPSLVGLAFCLMVVLIGPIHDFPVEDDWDYSRMVKIFIETGQIQRSDYAQATLIFPTLYGAAFSKLFGFSFTTLRFSTLLLALVALIAFYGLLGEMNFLYRIRILATLSLLATPVFVYLAFSFMTDIPALCWILLACLFYVRALHRDDPRQAAIGSLFAIVAFLTRQTGMLVPIAFALVTTWRLGLRSHLRLLAAGCVLPVAVLIAYVSAPTPNTTSNWATQNITLTLTLQGLGQPETWGLYFRRAVQSLLTIGIYIFPLLLGALGMARPRLKFSGTQFWGSTLVFAVLALTILLTVTRLATRGEWFPYLTDILTRAGLRPYLAFVAWDAGALRADLFAGWVYPTLTFGAIVAGLALAAFAVLNFRRLTSKQADAGVQFILALALLVAFPSILFATYYERYLLPLLPVAIVLVLDATRTYRISLAAVSLGLILSVSMIFALMQDYWGWNEARWRVGRELLSMRVPVEKIDGGYEWDGWYLYDKTVAYINATGKPFIYDPWQYVLDPEYVLAFRPMANYRIERLVPFPTPFTENFFYLLRRVEP